MSHTTPDVVVLARAAEIRSAGCAWEVVAARLLIPADEVREWPTLYPTEWKSALHEAERRLLADVSAESVLILRRLLRSEDEKVRRDAAKFLVDLRLELAKFDRPAEPPPPPPTSDAARFVALLEGQTDEQLDELLGACRRSELPATRGTVPETVAGAD